MNAALLEPACTQLQALVDALRTTPGVVAELAPVDIGTLTPAPLFQIQAVMQALRELLEQNDSDVQALWESHAPALQSVLPQAQAMERAIQGFDFEEALRLMPAA